MTPHYWHDATQHLSANCPTMAQIIASYPGELMQSRGNAFYTLMRSITGQQISVKAADAIWAKLEAKIKPMTPEKIMRARETTLRACGFSGQKVLYAKNLAQYFVEKGIIPPPVGGRLGGGRQVALAEPSNAPLPSSPLLGEEWLKLRAKHAGSPLRGEEFFATLSDDEVIKELTSIKGIGRWTAEMFLIFHLQRPDVYPLQDLGLIKAVERHYNKGEKLTKPALIAAGERFRPYRTVATWYLWRALDPVPVSY